MGILSVGDDSRGRYSSAGIFYSQLKIIIYEIYRFSGHSFPPVDDGAKLSTHVETRIYQDDNLMDVWRICAKKINDEFR